MKAYGPNPLTLNGNITAAGIVLNGGPVTLTGTNTFAGLGVNSGRTLSLAGSDTLNGNIEVYGQLNLNSATALAVTNVNYYLNLDPGSTIDNTSVGGPVTLTGANVPIANIEGNITFPGTNDLNLGTNAVRIGYVSSTNVQMTVAAHTLTIGGPISDYPWTGSHDGLVKVGTGTLVLSGANTYTGPTTVNGGTLELGANCPHPGAQQRRGQPRPRDTGVRLRQRLGPATVAMLRRTRVRERRSPARTRNAGDVWANIDDGTSKVTVAYTLPGDANLDFGVDGTDLNIVLSNYNQTGMTWRQGDFNGDGTVNGTDLNTVLVELQPERRRDRRRARAVNPAADGRGPGGSALLRLAEAEVT